MRYSRFRTQNSQKIDHNITINSQFLSTRCTMSGNVRKINFPFFAIFSFWDTYSYWDIFLILYSFLVNCEPDSETLTLFIYSWKTVIYRLIACVFWVWIIFIDWRISFVMKVLYRSHNQTYNIVRFY